MKPIMVLLASCLLALGVLAPGARAQTADWQKTWEATLAAARGEGKVVIIGSPDPVVRRDIIPAFGKRFPGIDIEYLAVQSSGQAANRVRVERAAGVYSVDVFLSGPDTQYNVLYPEKMIDPLKPLMILPEVVDGANWQRRAMTMPEFKPIREQMGRGPFSLDAKKR